MTQLGPAPSPSVLGTANRRFSRSCASMGNTTTVNTTRILGLWVPAECFLRGTVIHITTLIATASGIVRLSIGGSGNVVQGGVILTLTTAPGMNSYLTSDAVVANDGGLITRVDWSGAWVGTGVDATALAAVSSDTLFIQPLNFVELSTNGSFVVTHATMSVVSGGSSPRTYQEKLAV